MSVVLSGTLKYCACERNYAACGSVVPRITLQPSAGASASLAEVVRGGIEISGNFVYEVEPKFCIKVNFQPCLTLSNCLQIYSGWPSSYVDLFAYYQTRSISIWRVSLLSNESEIISSLQVTHFLLFLSLKYVHTRSCIYMYTHYMYVCIILLK